jgi:carotenoid cleavage dioxygenase-like enzyme
LFWEPELLKKNIHVVKFRRDMPSRFAVIPRYGTAKDIKWFEAAPTFVLHWLNAYEEGDEIVLDGYFEDDPEPKSHPDAPPGYERMMAYLDQSLIKPRLHRWRFNLKTGTTVEQRLDNRDLEFGMFNQKYGGKKYRYAYSAIPRPGWFMFTGLVKHDLEKGTSQSVSLGERRYASESPFVPRLNAKREDDGYLVSFVTDMVANRSECILIDALNLAAGPVCRIFLPHRISCGTHATWANASDIAAARKTRAELAAKAAA